MNRSTWIAPVALLFVALPACTPVNDALPSRCEAIEIDAARELTVTDPAIVGSPRLGFARVMAAVLGDDPDLSARAWMDAWSAVPGEASLADEVTQPWAAASARGLDLSRAPFELVAVANRIDLSTLSTPTSTRAGELRFVYGLVTASARRPLTVILELQLPASKSVAEWASAWHALGSLDGDAYPQGLLALVDAVLAEPLRGQVRTQDARRQTPLLLEFDLGTGAPLAPSALFNQPAGDVDPTALETFVTAEQQEVLAGTLVLPRSMLAASVTTVRPPPLSGVPSNVADAFVDTTCSGCHTAEPTVDGTFHISPLRRGADALSPFLSNPSGPPDELSRRAEILRGLLCGS
ncbi:MAG TPA: hypothetical protein VGL81_11160 [Polyangiaceae bacterium]